jgi:hypothetical protein
MTKKEKLEKIRKDHYKYIRSLGVDIDIDTGKLIIHLRVMICQI